MGMSEIKEGKSGQFDVFISYNHNPRDTAVAESLMTLLERYKRDGSPKLHVFRDKDELPSSGNLTEGLYNDLRASKFLVPICSPEYLKSMWCRKELLYFRQLHGNTNQNILPILVCGEPSESFPAELFSEKKSTQNPDGSVTTLLLDVEPLAADIRAETTRESLKKLKKKEYMRIVAPVLGLRFDDVYQRELRRKKRNLITAVASTVAALAIVLSAISFFAVRTHLAEQRYQQNLAEKGSEQIIAGGYEQAMMYYSEALSLNSKTQSAKTGALLLLQQYGWLNNTKTEQGYLVGDVRYNGSDNPKAVDSTGTKTLSQIRERGWIPNADGGRIELAGSGTVFLGSASDGSCWCFSAGSDVIFYFPAEDAAIKVPQPTAINPRCGKDEMDVFGSGLNAMALKRNRAVISCGGYMYLYSLDETSGRIEETYDLAKVFYESAEQNVMSAYYRMWFDIGGKLVIMSGTDGTAVFLAGKKGALNDLHKTHGRALNNAAFSSDGQYYALMYGNDLGVFNNPGGGLEVYDMYGNMRFSTVTDGGIPLKGAAFEPNGTRIAAWGNGEMQIWDWSTGKQVAAPIRMNEIESAVWQEDGQIVVSDGKGQLSFYSLVFFEAPKVEAGNLKTFVMPNYNLDEVVLNNGFRLKKLGIEIMVADSDGNITDEQTLADHSESVKNIDQMYFDKAHGIVYLWRRGFSGILAAKVDGRGKLAYIKELGTQQKNTLQVFSAWNGVLAETSSGALMYFEDGDDNPAAVLEPEAFGSVMSVVSNDSGLVSFVIRSQTYIEGYQFEYSYSLELWDLNKSVMLSELVKDSPHEITGLTFTSDSRLAFMHGNDMQSWLMNSPDPDDELLKTLASMTCFKLDGDQNAVAKAASFDPSALGSWKEYLCEIIKEPMPTAEESITKRMARLLEEKGAEEWRRAYVAWWNSDEVKSLSVYDICDIQSDYLSTAVSIGHPEYIRDILPSFFETVKPLVQVNPAYLVVIESNISRILIETPENADLAVDFFRFCAAYYELCWKANGEDGYLLGAYEYNLIAGILEGNGVAAFAFQYSPPYTDYAEDFLAACGLSYYSLIKGKPKEAASYVANSVKGSYFSAINTMAAFAATGHISEEDYSVFVSELGGQIGARLTQLTNANIESGLRLGDVVVAVNGVHFGTWSYLSLLKDDFTVASLTVVRDGRVFETEPCEDWMFYGGYSQ